MNAWNGIRSFYKDLAESLESYSEEDLDVAESVTSKLQNQHRYWLTSSQNQLFVSVSTSSLAPLDPDPSPSTTAIKRNTTEEGEC